MDTLREQWAAGKVTFGAWLTLAAEASAETAARLGFDFVCVDNQHGVADYHATVGLVQAIALGGSTPIVRVPWNEPGVAGRMLDAGVQGVVAPMINSRAEAEAMVRYCRYPPHGSRSFGPVLAGMRTPDYVERANDTVAVIPMIETAEALSHLDDILSVKGVDAIYVGPADLSLSLGMPPANNDDRREFTEALEAIIAGCRRHGVVPGIHSSGALGPRRVEQGFMMVTVASDLLSLRTHLASELATARRGKSAKGSGAIY